MGAVIDIAGNFKIYVPSGTEVLEFDMPGKIAFKRSQTQGVEVLAGDNAKGDYTLDITKKNLSAFSPVGNVRESFISVFAHYFYHTVKQKIVGGEVDKLHIILPLSFSIPFENLLFAGMKDKCRFGVFRDIEVYTAFYLNESLDLPELGHFAREDDGSHVYGITGSGDSFDLFLIDFHEDEPPRIIDFTTIESKSELFNTLKLLIKRHSYEKSKIFYFFDSKDDDIPGMTGRGGPQKDVEIEIEADKKVTIREMRKKNKTDMPLVKGIEHLEKNPEKAPLYQLSLFVQETGTDFCKIIPGKDLNISVDFRKKVPREFFVNFLVGPNSGNLILLQRVFVDLGAIVDKHLEFKGKFRQIDRQVKVRLMYKDEIDVESSFFLRKAYGITGD